MKSLRFGYSVLAVSTTAALLVGCGVLRQALDDTPPIGAPGTMPQSHVRPASYYQVLYRFDKYPNGEEPVAGLIDVGGTLYGTASDGGTRGCHGRGGCGTVYSITTKGVETLLFSFKTEDGVFPKSGLIDVKGILYGTTYQGGPSRRGTVYSITTTGSETVLHGFGGAPDGGLPVAGVVDVKGTLYGTTTFGGMKHASVTVKTPGAVPLPVPKCCGVFYSVSASGAEKVLYKFKGGSNGLNPYGGLINVKGTLYGTTTYGGASGCGCGTVYSITTAGVEKVLYRFAGGSDGEHPNGDLIDVNGTLYGTTAQGGVTACAYGCGTVYTVTTSGEEKVLYGFAGGSDGAHPRAGLIDVNGTLYGTTSEGGGTGCGNGCGTVYSISTAGAESVLYSFAGGSDGMSPAAPLLDVKGSLYGTTAAGGDPQNKQANCCGTVFALTP